VVSVVSSVVVGAAIAFSAVFVGSFNIYAGGIAAIIGGAIGGVLAAGNAINGLCYDPFKCFYNYKSCGTGECV